MCAKEQQHYTEQRNEERGRATKTLLRLRPNSSCATARSRGDQVNDGVGKERP